MARRYAMVVCGQNGVSIRKNPPETFQLGVKQAVPLSGE